MFVQYANCIYTSFVVEYKSNEGEAITNNPVQKGKNYEQR